MTWRVDAQKLVARYGPGAQAHQGVELRPLEGRQHGGDAGHALGVFLRRGVQVAVGVGDQRCCHVCLGTTPLCRSGAALQAL